MLDIAIVVLASLLDLLLFVLICRFATSVGIYRIQLVSFVISLSFICFFLAAGLVTFPNFTADLIIFSSFSYSFFHFNNMGETARRIRILTELSNNGGSLSIDNLSKIYSSREQVSLRIKRLKEAGDIVYQNGFFYITGYKIYCIEVLIYYCKFILNLLE